MKRKGSEPIGNFKRSRNFDASTLKNRIDEAKKRKESKERNIRTTADEHSTIASADKGLNTPVHPLLAKSESIGLNTPVHPLLLKPLSENEQASSSVAASGAGTASSNTGKASGRGQWNLRANPYLDHHADSSTLQRIERKSEFFDKSIDRHGNSTQARRRKGLVFHERGHFVNEANEIRESERIEREAKEQEAKVKAREAFLEITVGEREYYPHEPPIVEWWDQEFVSTYDEREITNPNATEITNLIQHPVIVDAPWDSKVPQQIKMYKTKKEIKRIRKNLRSEIHKEKQDRIRLGLDPAPPPKVKLSNMMSVFANEAIHNPTKVEATVRHQIAQRKEAHERDNAERQLTSEQRAAKVEAKIERDKASQGIYLAAFSVKKLADGKHKFLVHKNAKEFALTGMVLFGPAFALIIVEGSKLHVKKYAHLMTNRIKWTVKSEPRESDPTDTSRLTDLSDNTCSLIWQGQIAQSKFNRWSLHDVETEEQAQELLSPHDAFLYWIEASANPVSNDF